MILFSFRQKKRYYYQLFLSVRPSAQSANHSVRSVWNALGT